MMKITCLATIMLIASAILLHAQESRQLRPVTEIDGTLINDVDEASVAMHPATLYLESSTVILAEVDLNRIDVSELINWLGTLRDSSGLKWQAETIRGFMESLKGGGVSRIYLSAAARSLFDGGPVVIIPCENPAVVSGLASVVIQQLPDHESQKIHVGDKVVVTGAAPAVDRIVARHGVDRPDLILPLKDSDLLDHTIVISLPRELREELVAYWPEQMSFAPLNVPISPRQIASDVSCIVVSLRLPLDPDMMVRIETEDVVAAIRVQELIDSLLALSGELKSLVEVEVDAGNVILHATPEAYLKIASAIAAPARTRAQQLSRMNSIKQIGLALHNYLSTQKHFPPRVFTDAQVQPLLSWRVAILPFLDQSAMYRTIKLDQPWNSEANRQATSTLIPTYNFDQDVNMGTKTTLRAPVFPGSMWHGDGPPKTIRDIKDGTAFTIAIIDAPPSAAVDWADPQPWVISVDDPMSDVFGDRQTVMVGMLDGAALVLNRDEMSNEKLKAMLTIAGGEVIE